MDGKPDETRADLASEAAPEYAPDGVDLTLIRWMLSLTPEQRLQFLQDRQNALESVPNSPWKWTTEPS